MVEKKGGSSLEVRAFWNVSCELCGITQKAVQCSTWQKAGIPLDGNHQRDELLVPLPRLADGMQRDGYEQDRL